jgi:phage gpG-like protein
MFEDIGLSMVTSTQRRFEEGRGPGGSPWPPSIRALATDGKTLIESARLMKSQTFIASDTGVEVGTNVVYAAIHQLGGIIQQAERRHTIYRRYDEKADDLSVLFVKKSKANYAEDVTIPARDIKMPARPFLGVDEDDESEILAIAASYVSGPEARQ